jgi:hypothetical protein
MPIRRYVKNGVTFTPQALASIAGVDVAGRRIAPVRFGGR